MIKIDYFLAQRPACNEDRNGDFCVIKKLNGQLFVGIVDVSGHGDSAYKIAAACKKFLEKNYRKDLVFLTQALHKGMLKPRGGVATLARLDFKTGELRYVGVGNIAVRKFGKHCERAILQDGVVGYIMPSPKENTMKLDDGDAGEISDL